MRAAPSSATQPAILGECRLRLFAPHRWTSVEHTWIEKGMGTGIYW
ncbi:hypothetical protein [Rubripirellula obstinata]|nr:hypothetical protein [Rubripirellula obstinata]